MRAVDGRPEGIVDGTGGGAQWEIARAGTLVADVARTVTQQWARGALDVEDGHACVVAVARRDRRCPTLRSE